MTARPNIVVLMADQLAPQFLPCYGHPVVRAPHLARLAEQGVVFDAAYANSPLCAPARYVMMTGRLPSRIGAWDNAAELPAEVPTFAHYVADAGYRTCLSGKMHFVGPDQRHGFAERLTTDVYPADFAWHPRWDLPGERLPWYHDMEVVTKAGPCVRSLYLDYDDEVTFRARRWLYDRAREGGAEPFALVVSWIQPHDPYLCRREHWDLYRDGEIDLPAVAHGTVPEDPHAARLRRAYGASEIELDDATIGRARRAYYGAVSDVDDRVGAVLGTLAEAGLADDTVVVFTADHGDMLGERGLWFKMTFHEHAARVPLVVWAPRLFSARRVAEAVSLVDLLPTLAELAGDGAAPGYATPIEGRSLLPHLGGGAGHDEVLGEYFGEGVTEPMFMIRRGARKLIDGGADPPLLYDLADDPLETRNLAAGPAPDPVADRWRAELDARHDRAALATAVLESQARRRLVERVMRAQGVAWDHQPLEDATRAYVRNTVPILELERRGRFPPA